MQGILFTEEMFRAVTEGRKTQTRRIGSLEWLMPFEDVKLLSMDTDPQVINTGNPEGITRTWKGIYPQFNVPDAEFEYVYLRPRYQPGDIVFLKEPYLLQLYKGDFHPHYKFDKDDFSQKLASWQNKLFMPAKYARYFIRIKDVRVETILDISGEDAKAEGFDNVLDFLRTFRKINGKEAIKNDVFVFAYTFELTEKPENLTTQY